LEEQAVQTREEHDARERVRVEMAKWARSEQQIATGDPDIRDVAPHLVGRG
jgi:hypothetical protein